MAVTGARAVELVESLLTELPPGHPELVVHVVVEHSLGWIISCNSPEFVRTGDRQHALVGGGPYLVDLHDGSVHVIPATTFMAHDWEALYLRQVKGVRPPDPLADLTEEKVVCPPLSIGTVRPGHG
ncbi:YrhB domain-containing protein [Kitasatospora sp. NPDC054795]